MFPASLPRGRFPSGLPSLKLALGPGKSRSTSSAGKGCIPTSAHPGMPRSSHCCSGAAHALHWGIYDSSKALMGVTWVTMSQDSWLPGASACPTQLLEGSS